MRSGYALAPSMITACSMLVITSMFESFWHRGRMTVEVRHIATEDIDWARELNHANIPAVSDAGVERFAHLIDISVAPLIALVDGERAGFSLTMLAGADYDSVNYGWFRSRYDHFVYLDRVVVDEPYWGRGVGRALYEETERIGSLADPEAQVFALEVNVEPRNDRSLAFHDMLGFREVGRQRTPYGAVVAMMTRPITPR